MKKIVFLAFVAFLFSACGAEEKQDLTEKVNKEGAIETQLNIEHLENNMDVLISTHKVWVKGTLYKTIEQRDTIPALGNFSETNDKGEAVQGKKDYELYITVK